jgi:hypothetical protein
MGLLVSPFSHTVTVCGKAGKSKNGLLVGNLARGAAGGESDPVK